MSQCVETFNRMCWLTIDEVIAESVLGNHHYQMLRLVLLWNEIVTSSGGSFLLYKWHIDIPFFYYELNNWAFQHVVLIDYWWSYRGVSIGKPSLPNGVVLLWNEIVTSSGKCFLLYKWYIGSPLFNTMSPWIETSNIVCWLNIDRVIGESVLGNHHYQIVLFCYQII